MSGLVAYGSSSDEDGDVARPVVQGDHAKTSKQASSLNGAKLQTASLVSHSERDVGATDDRDAPMIGPTIPTASLESMDTYTSTPPPQQPISERDLIRHLTQASHPMTSLPPSPPGSPDANANAKFKQFLELKKKGVHFNEDLARKDTFRNPSLLGTMMARAGVEGDAQYSTSLPLSIWDVQMLPVFAYKEELLKSQQSIRDQDAASKKALSAAGKRTIEFTSGGASGGSSRTSTPGQQSKWKKP